MSYSAPNPDGTSYGYFQVGGEAYYGSPQVQHDANGYMDVNGNQQYDAPTPSLVNAVYIIAQSNSAGAHSADEPTYFSLPFAAAYAGALGGLYLLWNDFPLNEMRPVSSQGCLSFVSSATFSSRKRAQMGVFVCCDQTLNAHFG